MIDFTVTILGNGSAVPTQWQNPSGQVVVYGGNMFLVDCGEATQMQLLKYQINKSAIDHIFISHLHGDHFFGLIGLLSSYHLNYREKPLHIYAPEKLQDLIVHSLNVTQTTLRFDLLFHPHEKNTNGFLFTIKNLEAGLFPLKHSIPSWGIIFREIQLQLNIDKNFIEEYHPSFEQIKKIKEGSDFVLEDGNVIPNSEITKKPNHLRSYAYCSDTAFDLSIVTFVKDVSLLYHESTFIDSQTELAESVLHSTASQAATIALKANAEKLLLGHFSSRVKERELFEKEARTIFGSAYLSFEGETYRV